MTHKFVLLSREVVATSNGFVILICVLFVLGILLPSSQFHEFHDIANLMSALAPALTILFFLTQVPNRALAVVAIGANLSVLGSTLVFSSRIANANLPQPVLVLAAVCFVLLFLIATISIASVASNWPSGR